MAVSGRIISIRYIYNINYEMESFRKERRSTNGSRTLRDAVCTLYIWLQGIRRKNVLYLRRKFKVFAAFFVTSYDQTIKICRKHLYLKLLILKSIEVCQHREPC